MERSTAFGAETEHKSEQNGTDVTAYAQKARTHESPMDALKRLANSDYATEKQSTSRFMSDHLGIETDNGQSLEQRIRSFQKQQGSLIEEYIQTAKRRSQAIDNCFCVLNGWSSDKSQPGLEAIQQQQNCGGYFMRWQGKGVAINPGPQFLNNCHQNGLHVTDIDYVIVTRDCPEAYADVEAIYQLNHQVNAKNGTASDLHIIQYYLNQKSHRDIAARLKPHFKQERNTVHCLALYIDSPDIEKVELCPELCLHYFHTCLADSNKEGRASSIGIRIECKNQEGRLASAIGYVAGVPWSPLLAHNLGRCDLLVTGFDHTCQADYCKTQYNEDCLGYFGTYSLTEEVAPRILLCCEFSGRDGDIRLEAVKKMRQEYAYSQHSGTAILPGDNGLYVDLKSLQIRCSITSRPIDPSQARVIRTNDSFGKLQYLSPSCFI